MFTLIPDGCVRFAARFARSSALLVALTLLCLTAGFPARGQEDPLAPDISIAPDGATYSIAASTREEAVYAGGQEVEVTLVFGDSDGVNKNTLNVSVSSPGQAVPVTRTSLTSNEPTLARAKYKFTLFDQGDHVLNVSIADNTGKVGTRRATFKFVYTDPALPIVRLDPHHNDYRDTTIGAATLSYSMPGYTSFGVARAIGLRYDSEQADPTGFVQLDADISTFRRSYYQGGAYSLTIVDPSANNAPVTQETFWQLSGGRQRLAAHWSMRGRPTGAYNYVAQVRAYRSDGTAPALTQVPFRILVVNQVSSRYGRGWTVAGIQRIHSANPDTDDGFLLEEGTGVVRWFAKESCGYPLCTYRAPRGDFSRIVYDRVANEWVRTYTDNSVATFAGRGQGLLIKTSDPFGRTTTYSWQLPADGQNIPLLAQVADPAGKVTTLTYHGGNYLGEIVDPAGRHAWFYGSHANLGPIYGPTSEANLSLAYDANNKVTSYTDARGTWNIEYDAFRRMTSLKAPSIAIGRPEVRFKSLEAALLPPCPAASPKCWRPAVPSGEAYMTVTDPGGHETKVASDRYGGPVTVIDPSGMAVTTLRTADGLAWQTTSSLQTSTIGWTATGQKLSEEVNGTLTFHGSVAGTRHDYINEQGEGRWFTYGDRGQLLKTWIGKKTDSSRTATVYTYDSLYRLISVVGPNGERTEWSYEPVWQNVSEVRWLDGSGKWQKQTFAYDTAGRVQSTTNALGETAVTTYDKLNRPVQVVDAERVLEFDYTGLDLTAVTVPGGNKYSYRYNALGWLESETFPDGKSRSVTYNIDGLVTGQTDRRGRTVALQYDPAHRVTSALADGQTTNNASITIAYPPAYTAGAKIVLQNGEVQESFAFGNDGSIASTTYAMGSRSYVIDRILDAYNGWEQTGIDIHGYYGTAHQHTDFVRYETERNPADPALLSAFHIDDYDPSTYTMKRTSLAFDTSGRHIKTTFANSVVQQNTYNNLGLRTFTTFTPASSLSASYEYDALGRLKSRGATGQSTKVYHYDRYARLQYFQRSNWHPTAGWVAAYDEHWSYDLAGNRYNKGGTIEPNSNRYLTYDGYSLEYDPEGNLTRRYKAGYEQRLEWNALGQLSSVTTNGTTVTYGYTPSGLRFRRTAGGTSRYYVYFDGDLLLELGNDGLPVRRYVHLPGTDKPLSVIETVAGVERTYYFALDHPGHVLALMNSSGAVTATYDYLPFGAETTAASDGQPLRFMARELDFSTGLYYVRNRWYDPALARFVSEDPIGLAGGLNTYAYVDNDPVNRRDPSGLSPCSEKDRKKESYNKCEDPILLDAITVVARRKTQPSSSENYDYYPLPGRRADVGRFFGSGVDSVPSVGPPRPSVSGAPPQPSRQCGRASIIAGANVLLDLASTLGPGMILKAGRVVAKSGGMVPLFTKASLGINRGRDGAAVLTMTNHARVWGAVAATTSSSIAMGQMESQLASDGGYGVIDALIDLTPGLNSIEAIDTALGACFGEGK
jgi:RHS repeat-associated protein